MRILFLLFFFMIGFLQISSAKTGDFKVDELEDNVGCSFWVESVPYNPSLGKTILWAGSWHEGYKELFPEPRNQSFILLKIDGKIVQIPVPESQGFPQIGKKQQFRKGDLVIETLLESNGRESNEFYKGHIWIKKGKIQKGFKVKGMCGC